MSKEIQLLKSKLEYCKTIINFYKALKSLYKSNKYDKIIEYNQNDLSKIYKRIQELKEEE